MEDCFFLLFKNFQAMFITEIIPEFQNSKYRILIILKKESCDVEILMSIQLLEFQKSLNFHYTIGYNSVGQMNSISYLEIENLFNGKKIDLDDYNKYMGKNNCFRMYSIFQNVNNESSKMHVFMKGIKDFLSDNSFRKLLFTDYWVDVPINYSPYK